MTPEEKIVEFISRLVYALGLAEFDTNTRTSMAIAAIPAVTAYYLKGQ